MHRAGEAWKRLLFPARAEQSGLAAERQISFMIVKEKGAYVVKSEKNGRVFGHYKTKKEAERRLRQIEFFKRQKSKGKV